MKYANAKIGDIIRLNETTIKVVDEDMGVYNCDDCYFNDKECSHIACMMSERDEPISVTFIEDLRSHRSPSNDF